MKQKLFVLLGDVVSSRQIADRDLFQSRLIEICRSINDRYGNDIFAPFKILKGLDEMGGVLENISNFYNIINTVAESLYPQAMRWALVYDFVDTALDSGDVSKMDGPAFHRSSQSILQLKKTERLMSLSVEDEILDRVLTGEINLLLLFRHEISPRQRKIIKEYELVKNQMEVAERFGISQQSVSLALRRSRWKMIKDLEDELNHSLQGYQKRIHQTNLGSNPV